VCSRAEPKPTSAATMLLVHISPSPTRLICSPRAPAGGGRGRRGCGGQKVVHQKSTSSGGRSPIGTKSASSAGRTAHCQTESRVNLSLRCHWPKPY
jgi:hypothetical protein